MKQSPSRQNNAASFSKKINPPPIDYSFAQKNLNDRLRVFQLITQLSQKLKSAGFS